MLSHKTMKTHYLFSTLTALWSYNKLFDQRPKLDWQKIKLPSQNVTQGVHFYNRTDVFPRRLSG